MDELESMLKKLYNYEGYVFWSFLFAFIHTLFSPKNRSVLAYFIAAITCVPVGVLSGMAARDYGLNESTTYILVSMAALLAQDIVKLVLEIGGFINTNSDAIISNVYKFVTKKLTNYLNSKFPDK